MTPRRSCGTASSAQSTGRSSTTRRSACAFRAPPFIHRRRRLPLWPRLHVHVAWLRIVWVFFMSRVPLAYFRFPYQMIQKQQIFLVAGVLTLANAKVATWPGAAFALCPSWSRLSSRRSPRRRTRATLTRSSRRRPSPSLRRRNVRPPVTPRGGACTGR